MIDVESIIASIEAEKKSRNVSPSYAMMEEITNKVTEQVKSELNNGVAGGRLRWHETLNSYGFSTIKNK